MLGSNTSVWSLHAVTKPVSAAFLGFCFLVRDQQRDFPGVEFKVLIEF